MKVPDTYKITILCYLSTCIILHGDICQYEIVHYHFAAGCSPPSPTVNGSVSEFTSSRVGAQVTYSCDTDLVLVGERVATCSEPSLQWLPSSEDIMCVQPPGTLLLTWSRGFIWIEYLYSVCGDPSENLPRNASISSRNGSVVTYSCDPGYSLHGSTTSQCLSGEWTPSPETVMCIAMNTPIPSKEKDGIILICFYVPWIY